MNENVWNADEDAQLKVAGETIKTGEELTASDIKQAAKEKGLSDFKVVRESDGSIVSKSEPPVSEDIRLESVDKAGEE